MTLMKWTMQEASQIGLLLFFDEFQKYRGYDLRQHLPALLGMDTPDKNARVLYDYRQTINDLLINHYSIRWSTLGGKTRKGYKESGSWFSCQYSGFVCSE